MQEQNPVVLSSDDDEEDAPTQTNNNQIVLYDPTITQKTEPEPESDPIQWRPPPPPFTSAQKVLPSVGSFTVQCAACYKWRLIPSKEKYEEIRESILQCPFTCDVAKEWRGDGICCDTPADIKQDNSRLWAIDKPSIAQPPPGWERELRIRGEGCSKFADVYYIAPSGKRLRSMVEVQKYLYEHQEFIMKGVTLSQFSFQIPKPLQENYVRKRTPRSLHDDSKFGMSRPFPTIAASPLSWAAPDDASTLQLAHPGFSADVTPPAKKKARSSTKHTQSRVPVQLSPNKFKIKGPRLPSNGVYDL